ncbi:MAG: hypothetical protein EPO08_09885 [Rhodospirillaceae bacterium]|nr:MAG: hypothetical protein EPO08_09885 [Rhodospirillaceae bacterium]
MTPEQIETKKLLTRTLGQEFATRYEDLCTLSTPLASLQIDLPLATHAMREMESMLRGILPKSGLPELTAETKGKLEQAKRQLLDLKFDSQRVHDAVKRLYENTQRAQINGVLRALDIDQESDTAKAWLAFGKQQAGLAHKRSWRKRLKLDSDFSSETIFPFLSVIRGVALAFEAKYPSFIARVDELALGQDKDAAIAEFAEKIPHSPAVESRFFSRIEPSGWLGLLNNHDFYADRGVEHPQFDKSWNQGTYLARVAAAPDASEQSLVLAIVKGLAASVDAVIRENCLKALMALPAAESASATFIVEAWLDKSLDRDVTRLTLQFAQKLAKGRQFEPAIRLCRKLLRVWRQGEGSDLESHFAPRGIYEWAVQKIAPGLIEGAPLLAFELFCSLLSEAGQASRLFSADSKHDHSNIWRKTIADNADNSRSEIGVLITATRDSAMQLTKVAEASEVVKLLSAQPYPMFRRIALHVLANAGGASLELASSALSDMELIADATYDHEYTALARAAFSQLSPDVQNAIIKQIETSLEIITPRWRAWFESENSRPPTAEEERKSMLVARRDKYWDWREALPTEKKAEIKAIAVEFGDPEPWPPAFMRLGSESPVTPEELSEWPSDKLSAYLVAWSPDRKEREIAISGLEQAVEKAARDNPVLFALAAQGLGNAVPEIHRCIFAGLLAAAKHNEKFPWNGVLSLIEKITDLVLNLPNSQINRQNSALAAELLKLGFMTLPCQMPSEFVDRAWAATVALTGAVPADDTANDEEGARHRHFRAAHTTAGTAIEAMIWYAVRRLRYPAPGDAPIALFQDLPVGPIVDALLDDRSSRATQWRLVVGGQLWRLIELDDHWVTTRLGKLFPPENIALGEAIWRGHLEGGRLTSKAAALLVDQYKSASTSIRSDVALEDPDGGHDRISRRLINDIAHAYVLGFYNVNSDSPVDAILAHGDDPVNADIISIVGHAAQDIFNQPADQQTSISIERARNYWVLRKETWTGTPQTYQLEASKVAEWVQHSAFDSTWRLQQLSCALEKGVLLDSPWDIFPWLAEMADEDPVQVVGILYAMVTHPAANQYTVNGPDEDVETILSAALACGDAAGVRKAESLIGALTTRGNLSFLSMISGDQQTSRAQT